MVTTLTMVVVVLQVSVTAALVVTTVVVTGTVEVTVDAETVIDFTGMEAARITTISGGPVVVDVVVLIDVLAEARASFVLHLSMVNVEKPTVIVKSALTFSNRAKKKKNWNIIIMRYG